MLGRLFNSFALSHDCTLCGDKAQLGNLCRACNSDLPHQSTDRCPQCAARSLADATCGPCLRKPPAFDQTISAFDYDFPLDQMVQRLKYASDLSLTELFSNALIARLVAQQKNTTWVTPDLIVIAPLSLARIRERGFNQSAEIAKRVARATQLPLELQVLDKILDGLPQAQMPWKERQKNVRGAYAVNKKHTDRLKDKRIAIIDDVMTTGATLNEIANVLRKSGAKHLQAWVIARTQPDHFKQKRGSVI